MKENIWHIHYVRGKCRQQYPPFDTAIREMHFTLFAEEKNENC